MTLRRIGLLLLAASAAGCGAAPARPPVLVVVVDALRADHLGAYGYERATSPAIDRIANDAVLFERARAAAPWTKPSIPSLFTSLYPSAHGVFEGNADGDDGGFLTDLLPEEAETLAELFAGCGYRTGAFVHNAHLSARYGFAQGFGSYLEGDRDAATLVDALLRFVDEAPERTFFGYLHVLDVHWPYEPPPAALRALGLEPDGAAPDRKLVDAVNVGALPPEAVDLERLLDLYDAGIRAVDAEIGRLRTELEARGLWDDAIVVLTSDHGEAFLEHGVLGHGHDLHEEQLRVPLLVKRPGGQGAGRRAAAPASLVDILPTLARLARCEDGAAASRQGVDLFGDAARVHPLAAEVRHGASLQQAVYDGPLKLIRAAAAPPRAGTGSPLIGARVELRGARAGAGRFAVERIEVEPPGDRDDEITGTLEAIDHDAGTLRAAGFTVEIDRALLLDAEKRRMTLAGLAAGTPVKIDGRAAGPDRFVAEKVRRLASPRRPRLEGLVRAIRAEEGGMAVLEVCGLSVALPASRLAGLEREAAARAAEGPPPRVSLYDLASDPAERRDLAGERPGEAERLTRRLDAWRRGIAAAALPPGGRRRLDGGAVEALRTLGYIE